MVLRRALFLGFFLLVSCDREKKESAAVLGDEKLALLEPVAELDPAAEEKTSLQRCSQLPGGKHVTLRPSGQSNSSSTELGSATSVAGGYAVGALIHGAETHAHVHIVDGRGRTQAADLGRVHGSVDPPQLAHAGDDVLAVFMDNDAGHQRLRLARVTAIASRPEVAFGPEIQVPRGEETTFSVSVAEPEDPRKGSAGGLMVWDDLDKSSQKSRIFALSFDPQNMKVSRKERVISPSNHDAVSPLVVSRNSGFWITWLSYGDSSEASAATDSLVEERQRTLRVQRLSSDGDPEGEPMSVTDPHETVFAYTALPLKTGGLLVAYRGASLGRTEGGSPIHLRKVGEDGSVISGLAEHAELGLGAPVLLGGNDSDLAWLSARGKESEILLGVVSDSAQVSQFELESGLSGHIPLTRRGDELLLAQPDGVDLKLSVFRCKL